MLFATPESSLRVLVVDDDVDTIESTALLFKMQGHEARSADAGADAIKLAEVFCPQLILLDIAMPKMDGFEVMRQLQRMPCMTDSVFVALTGYARPDDRRRCAEAGFDLHFAKPLDFAVLEQIIPTPPAGGVSEKSAELDSRQTEAFLTFVATAIEMANTFLDLSTDNANADIRRRCLAKAEKVHLKMTELVRRKAADRHHLLAALEHLQRRYTRLRLGL